MCLRSTGGETCNEYRGANADPRKAGVIWKVYEASVRCKYQLETIWEVQKPYIALRSVWPLPNLVPVMKSYIPNA